MHPMNDLHESSSATPMLDSGVLPPPRPKKRVLGVIIGFIIGIAFAVVVGLMGDSHVRGNIALLSYFAILAMVVTVHELGHLAAGWSVGFHFSHISVGPFALTIQYGRLKAQFRRGLGALGYAGMHIDKVSSLRRRLLFYAAAGPAANLVSGMIAVLFIHFAPPPSRTTWVAPMAAGFSVLSFVIGGLSLVALRIDAAE
jgi:hypothetical protein